MLPRWDRVDLGTMAIKGYSAIPKAPALLLWEFFPPVCVDGFPLKFEWQYVFVNPSALVECDPRSLFKRSITGFNKEFSFSLIGCATKAKEPSLPFYLPIAGERIIRFISFSRVSEHCKMQLVSSRIWTCATVSICTTCIAVWVTVSLFRSLGFFSVFWSIIIMP